MLYGGTTTANASGNYCSTGCPWCTCSNPYCSNYLGTNFVTTNNIVAEAKVIRKLLKTWQIWVDWRSDYRSNVKRFPHFAVLRQVWRPVHRRAGRARRHAFGHSPRKWCWA